MAKTRRMKVLIVDNERDFASTLAERMSARNIETESVYSGEEALDILAHFRPDVIILDMQMPSMSGLEVLSQVKTIDPSIEVILLTGHGSIEAGIAGMEMGVFDYIIKPVDLTLLMEKVKDAFNKKQGK